MSYLNPNSTRARSGTIIAVAALHVGAAYVLATGLGIDYVRETIANLPSRNVPAPPPEPEPVPEPPAQEKAATNPEIVDAMEPFLPRAAVNDFVVNLPVREPVMPEVTLPIVPLPPTPAPPVFEPVAAAPKGNPGAWFSTNDYPTRDIRQGNEGTALFRLAIDSSGRVSDCRITRSSGHSGLDKATCEKASQNARFEPARDSTGKRVSGSYTGKITWVIPR